MISIQNHLNFCVITPKFSHVRGTQNTGKCLESTLFHGQFIKYFVDHLRTLHVRFGMTSVLAAVAVVPRRRLRVTPAAGLPIVHM